MRSISKGVLYAACLLLCSSSASAQFDVVLGTTSDYTIHAFAGNGTYDGTQEPFAIRLYDGSWGAWHWVHGGIPKGTSRQKHLSDGIHLPSVTKLQAYVANDGARFTFTVVKGSKYIAFWNSKWVKNSIKTFDFTFKHWPSGNPNGSQCDIWQQDCPDGYRCIAEDVHGEPRCRALSDNPDQVGDSCSDLGVNDGDSCDVDGICINGVCEALCQGTALNPQCPDLDQVCRIYDEVPVCQEECDPLLFAACGAAETCTAEWGALEEFSCTPTDGPLGVSGDPCTDITQCAQGHACLPAATQPFGFCDGGTADCCVPMCDLDEADVCSGATSCLPFYQAPPPGLEHVGVCAIGL